MPIARSPGCNCCGSTTAPCECCVDTELKPLPVKTGLSFSDTTWADGWVGVDDPSSNTLPANAHAYIDIEMSCQSSYWIEVEVIDFGANAGAKIWCGGMEATNYRTSTASGKSLVVSGVTGLSYGLAGVPTGSSFGGERYMAVQLSSHWRQGGMQSSGVSMQDAPEQRIDDGEVFFPTYFAHALWHHEQNPLGPGTIRLNITTDSSEVKIGQVRLRHGWSGCNVASSHETGDNSTFCYASDGISIVNSGALSVTTTETSSGVTWDASCPVADPRPCDTWVNTLETDYTPLNGTFEYELKRTTNYWEANNSPSTPYVYEDADWALVNDWTTAIKNWEWTDTVRPIPFWEYFQFEPAVEVTMGNYSWDDSWSVWEFGDDVCGLVPITFHTVIPPLGPDQCPAFAESINAPVATHTRRQSFNLLKCWAVSICNLATDFVNPAMTLGTDPCFEDQVEKVYPIVFETDPSGAAHPDWTVPEIDIDVDQDGPFDNSDCYSGNWNYTLTRAGFTMSRSKDWRIESFTDFDTGAKSQPWLVKSGTITDLVIEDISGGTTANQDGESYVPQTLTFIPGQDPNTSDCNPDDVYGTEGITPSPTYGQGQFCGEDIRSSPWTRVDMDDGSVWDLSIEDNWLVDFTVTARRHSDCATIVGSINGIPADKCDTVDVTFSDSSFSVSFTWRIA